MSSKTKAKRSAKGFFKKKKNDLLKKKESQKKENSVKKDGGKRIKHKVVASKPGKEFFKSSLEGTFDDKDSWNHFFSALKPFVIAGVALAVLRFDPFHLGKNCIKAFGYVGKLVSFLCGNLPLSSAMVSACVFNLVSLVSLCGTAFWVIYAIKKRKKRKLEKATKVETEVSLDKEDSFSKTAIDELEEKTKSLSEEVLSSGEINFKGVPLQDEVETEVKKAETGLPLTETSTESLVEEETLESKKDRLESTMKQDDSELIEKTPSGYVARIHALKEQIKQCEILKVDLDNPISSSHKEETYFNYLLRSSEKKYANKELTEDAYELEKKQLIEAKNNGSLIKSYKKLILSNINEQIEILEKNIDMLIEEYESIDFKGKLSENYDRGVSLA